MDKLDTMVMNALDIAQSKALEMKHSELTIEHLLWGFLQCPQSKLAQKGESIRSSVTGKLKTYSVLNSVTLDQLKPSKLFTQWLMQAGALAAEQGDDKISESSLLRALKKVCDDYPLPDELYAHSEQEVPNFLMDLNALALDGKLDPVIGRNREIRSVIEILGRRSKNNPVLIGPAGVGKTAIIEGLAEQISKGSVPEILKGKTVYSLNMGSLMAGTKFRGEFEERIQTLLDFIKGKQGQAILFIDELHLLIGAGKVDNAMDAANLLKPALARGELHCIGATTPDEYQKYILKDAALDRRFRPVKVSEPSKEDAIEILMGIRDKHEMHHGIKISDEAIFSAVLLSSQYITDKHLPDKAIDLIDEASSALKLSAEAMPAELSQLEADIRSKKILAKVEPKNDLVQKEISQMQEKLEAAKLIWEKEVSSLRKLSTVKNSIDRLKFDFERAERDGDFDKASQVKYGLLPDLEKELESLQHAWVLGSQHIARVISHQTGISQEKILQGKQEKILELESFLQGRVFGQEESLSEIAQTLLTSYAGLSDPGRPMGSFLLKGPTGVGKTETAKALAAFLFDSEKSLIRIDMSEFSEKHSVAKLIGAPAGYVGYEDGGVLTEAIRNKPYSIILFDELEKAHPDFSDILLQILDEGHLTDSKGRTVDFKNTIVVLTTNSVHLDQDFKPEVLGRIDGVLEFNPLGHDVTQKLVTVLLRQLNERLKAKEIKVELSSSVREKIITQGCGQQFGARPLKQVFNKVVSRPLAQSIVKGDFQPGSYLLSLRDDCLQIEAQASI